MSEKELDDLMLKSPLMRLATVSKKGVPHASTLWYVYSDGCIYFTADGKTQKMRNIKANKRVSLVVDSGHELFKVKGVKVDGEANAVEDEALKRSLRTLFAKKYFGSIDNPDFERLDFYMRKQVFIEIRPSKITTWDYTKWRKS